LNATSPLTCSDKTKFCKELVHTCVCMAMGRIQPPSGGSFLGVGRQKREANHSPLSSVLYLYGMVLMQRNRFYKLFAQCELRQNEVGQVA
jgi:hypothetical protein